jgi:hypothetical protein
MNEQEQLDLKALRVLADRLRLVPRVHRIARTEPEVEDVATEAASAILQIQRACIVVSNLRPNLETLSPGSAEFADVLDDIAEEFRLIHYQIVHTRLFNYIVPD